MMKTLVLIRHGHRDVDADERDNGLTARGRVQAHAVADFFRARFPAETPGVALVSSPKTRCRETLAPLSLALGLDVVVDDRVDEGRSRETLAAFDGRIQTFLREWRASRVRFTVVCSHNDWIPRAAHALFGQSLDVPNGSWLEVEWRGGATELAWFVPTFAPFSTRT